MGDGGWAIFLPRVRRGVNPRPARYRAGGVMGDTLWTRSTSYNQGMAMTFVPVGVGDAFSALHHSSAVAVEAGGRWLLVDCPHPIRRVLREASQRAGVAIDVGSFDAVVVTHLHADHCSGLEDYAYFHRFVLQRRPVLAAHPRVLGRLWERLAPGMDSLSDPADWSSRPMRLEDYFDVVQLDDRAPVQVGALELAC